MKKYRHVFLYLFFGVLTTLVNWLVYFLLRKRLGVTVSNLFAWIVSVGFAYLTNKTFVFQSPNWSKAVVLPELLRFALCRVGSMALETGLLYILVSVCAQPEVMVKIAVGFIVFAVNYAASKFLAFRGETGK